MKNNKFKYILLSAALFALCPSFAKCEINYVNFDNNAVAASSQTAPAMTEEQNAKSEPTAAAAEEILPPLTPDTTPSAEVVQSTSPAPSEEIVILDTPESAAPTAEEAAAETAEQTEQAAPKTAPAKVKKQIVKPLPPEEAKDTSSLDDEMVKKYQGTAIYRYKVCVQGNVPNVYKYGTQKNKAKKQAEDEAPSGEEAQSEQESKNYSEIHLDKEVKCNYYYSKSDAASKALMVKAALKDFNLESPTDVIINDPVEIKEINGLPFSIAGAKITDEDVRLKEGNLVHKKVFNSPAKIKKLYNYETSLAEQIANLMEERSSSAMPIRITVYEYYPEEDASWAGAVIVFDEMDKKFVPLNDVILEKNLYGLKPDVSYKYTLKQTAI